jgi:hypothetical protein
VICTLVFFEDILVDAVAPDRILNVKPRFLRFHRQVID